MVLEGDGGAFDDLAQERVKEAPPYVVTRKPQQEKP
jgi:hypothetical protein